MAPNPMVGAIVAHGDTVVGAGWHHQVGGPHAEVHALAAAGERARGATLYVTLEPCSHHGRTPPCADAVVAAGVARVVACHGDPDPRVAGRGFDRLRQAGIQVEVGTLAAQAARLNLRFLVAATAGRPLVTLKWAMSLDGKIATAGGQSQWISSPAGRRWALAQREEHDAILVGSGTVLADDPRLDRRLGLAGRPNLRVVLDRRLRLAERAAAAAVAASSTANWRLFDAPGPVLIYAEAGGLGAPDAPGASGAPEGAAGQDGPGGAPFQDGEMAGWLPPEASRQMPRADGPAGQSRRKAEGKASQADRMAGVRLLEASGATVVVLPVVEPAAVLADLYARQVRSVLVEGGAQVLASFVAGGLYDQVAIDCAPLLIGGAAAPGPLGGRGAAALAAAPRLDHFQARRRGGDLILTGLRSGCLHQLLARVLPQSVPTLP